MSDTSNLLAEQRRALILDEVRRRGGVRVNELTQRLNVSDMTIRRDLDALARAGAVEKVHGGAVAAGAALAHEPGFEAKSSLEPSAKEQIARAAAALVTPGSAIALSGGTTTYALAQQLLEIEQLTVVTNSVPVSEVFERARRQGNGAGTTVVLTGGVRTPSDALVGPVADRSIRSLRFDLLFLGAHGLSAEAGLSTPNLAEAETNRTLIESARRTVVVADHTKWGVIGLSTIAPLDAVDTWVTDPGIAAQDAAGAREHLRALLIAD
ncbi:DeoR/GlpR family DNA-binding transcription regulator [Kitasatospora sp. NPDC002040]|uniref:DeoR/GlpR family DNA-binding transcription regulator n=1 Tax=Kitasatospora sp. NPDC002040 TaxID=3154661 RepID=UPI0033206794